MYAVTAFTPDFIGAITEYFDLGSAVLQHAASSTDPQTHIEFTLASKNHRALDCRVATASQCAMWRDIIAAKKKAVLKLLSVYVSSQSTNLIDRVLHVLVVIRIDV